MKTLPLLAATLLLGLGLAACQQRAPDTPKTGQTCHVVSGDNAGKQGRYDDEGACCDADASGEEVPGGWGCTECGGANAGKCKDGPKPNLGGAAVTPDQRPDVAAPR